jgi:hypothetical protein
VIEKVATWAIGKVVSEELDDSVATAALVGVALDSASYAAMGIPPKAAIAAGAATGMAQHAYRKSRKKG